MSISNKLRAVLNIAEKKPSDLSECLGISVQAVRNKFSRDSFSVSDIIKITDSLGWELQCTAPNGQTVVLTMEDIKKTPTLAEPPAAGPKEPERQQAPEPEQQAASAPRQRQAQYRRFTEAEAAQIDLSRLLTDGRYQMQIAGDFGIDVLNTLAAKAKQQASTPDPDATPEK